MVVLVLGLGGELVEGLAGLGALAGLEGAAVLRLFGALTSLMTPLSLPALSSAAAAVFGPLL